MKKFTILILIFMVSACSFSGRYPYGLTEGEWNSLSIRDQAKLRRDFYFYEKGTPAYVNPNLEVEGYDAMDTYAYND